MIGAVSAAPAAAADSDAVRPYLQLHAGQAIFVDPNSGPLDLGNPSDEPFVGGILGVNLNRNWGVQVTGFTGETQLASPTRGKVAELGIWTFLGELRWRYPMLNDKFVPYGLAGAGILLGEVNNQNLNSTFPRVNGDDSAFVGAIGIGAEYFAAHNVAAHNVALGFEVKYVFPFNPKIQISRQDADLHLDPLLVTAGLRLFFQ